MTQLWENICCHILSLELLVTSSRFRAGKSRCDHCGECLMWASGRKTVRVERCWKAVKTHQFFSRVRSPAFWCRIHNRARQTVCIQTTRIKIPDAGPPTGRRCSTTVQARSPCGDIYRNVRWHRVCHTVKRGITGCVSAGRLPTPTFNYHTHDDIYSHEGPHSAWASVSSLRCQSIKLSELSSWQLDATIGWDDAWLIIRYWSQVRPSSRCAGKVID